MRKTSCRCRKNAIFHHRRKWIWIIWRILNREIALSGYFSAGMCRCEKSICMMRCKYACFRGLELRRKSWYVRTRNVGKILNPVKRIKNIAVQSAASAGRTLSTSRKCEEWFIRKNAVAVGKRLKQKPKKHSIARHAHTTTRGQIAEKE